MGALIYFDGTDYDNPIGWGKLHMTNNFMNSKPSPINQAKWLGIRHQQLIAFCLFAWGFTLHSPSVHLQLAEFDGLTDEVSDLSGAHDLDGPFSLGWWFGTWLLWLSIYWEWSSQLTFIFFRGVGIPPTSRWIGLPCLGCCFAAVFAWKNKLYPSKNWTCPQRDQPHSKNKRRTWFPKLGMLIEMTWCSWVEREISSMSPQW